MRALRLQHLLFYLNLTNAGTLLPAIVEMFLEEWGNMGNLIKIFAVMALLCSQGAFAGSENQTKVENESPAGWIKRLTAFFSPEEIEFDQSRRRVLRGGVSLGVVALTGGGGLAANLFESGRQKLPDALKKKLVALRRAKGSGHITLDADNLRAYKAALNEALKDYPQARKAILERVARIDGVLENEPLLESIADTRPHPDTIGNDVFRQERIRKRLSDEAARAMEIEAMPSLEEAVLAARSFLDSMLLKKIGYQIILANPQKGEYVLAFNSSEARLVRMYSALINSLAKKQEKLQVKHDFLSKWLPRLKYEADLALKLYEESRKHFIVTCKGFL